jgi:hypothetical protein
MPEFAAMPQRHTQNVKMMRWKAREILAYGGACPCINTILVFYLATGKW